MKKFKLWIFNIGVIVVLFSCNKRPSNWCQPHYDFQVHLEVYPDTYTYQLGDTIRLSMATDNSALIDSFDDRVVEYPNFDPRLNFFLNLFENTQNVDGTNTLEFFTDSVSEVSIKNISGFNQNNLKLVTIDTSEATSQFKLGLVPGIAGRYALYCHPSLMEFSISETFPDRCEYQLRGNELNVTTYFNDSRDLNKQILSQSDLDLEVIYWDGYTGSKSLSSAFYFEVE